VTESERLIRLGYDAWNRGDWPAMQNMVTPDFEVDATDRVLNPEAYSGIDGVRRLADEMFEIWDAWLIEPGEFVERGDEVFVEHNIKARGKGSGVQLEQTYWSVWTIRDGKAARLALYVDRDRALGAIGR
jgi:ketosteroid isomerase-like protein